MSWYAEIIGEIVTSLKAKPLVIEVIGKWTQPEAEGEVQLKENPKKGILEISLSGCYRNLGRYIEHEIYKVTQKFPKETQGSFCMCSTDGDLFAAEYSIREGKLFRRGLSMDEKEIVPVEAKLGEKDYLTVMLEKEGLEERKPSKYTCDACGGQLQVVEAVSGCFSYPVRGDLVDWNDREYAGDSWLHVECIDCHKILSQYEVADDKVVLSTEDE